MSKPMRILLIQGHPDARKAHFCHALAESYRRAAADAGHETQTLEISRMQFPFLRSAEEWGDAPGGEILEAQRLVRWADHLVIVFPLWLGDMPALVKAFFEQVLRPGFAIGKAPPGRLWKKLLKGRSARVIVTMGMPSFFYRIYYRAHSLRSLRRNILEFCGITPVRTTLVGTVETDAIGHRELWLAKVAAFGAKGN